MIVLSLLLALLLIGVLVLSWLGFRAGDRSGDVVLLAVEPERDPRGLAVTVLNPGAAPVVSGMSLRRIRLRARLGGPLYVRVQTRRTAPDLLAGRQTAIGAVAPGETATFCVAAGPELPAAAQLVAVIGQPQRLRTIHRMVRLPAAGHSATRARERSIAVRT